MHIQVDCKTWFYTLSLMYPDDYPCTICIWGWDCVLQLELEKVIGLTTSSANGLSCNVATGDLAYLAGCVVVIYNVKANCQTRFLMAPKSPKAFSCVSYSSQGGKFIAAGEVFRQLNTLNKLLELI